MLNGLGQWKTIWLWSQMTDELGSFCCYNEIPEKISL